MNQNRIHEESSQKKDQEREKWDNLFHLLNKTERSKLENSINLVVNSEQDDEGNIIGLFISDYGLKKEIKAPPYIPYPNCTFFLNDLYGIDKDSTNPRSMESMDSALDKESHTTSTSFTDGTGIGRANAIRTSSEFLPDAVLKKLQKQCEKMAHQLTQGNKKNFKNNSKSGGDQNSEKTVNMRFVNFNPQENILDAYLNEHYPNQVFSMEQVGTPTIHESGRSSMGNTGGDKQNVCLYCYSSPRIPEICFGKDNIKKNTFKTDFQYSIFDLSSYDEKPDHEIILDQGLKPTLDDNFPKEKYPLWRRFVTEYFQDHEKGADLAFFNGEKTQESLDKSDKAMARKSDYYKSATQGGNKSQAVSLSKESQEAIGHGSQSEGVVLKKQKKRETFLKDPKGFLEWNLVKTNFLLIVFGEKLKNYNQTLKDAFEFGEQMSFVWDLPNTADEMIEETFLRYLKTFIEKESVIDVPISAPIGPIGRRGSTGTASAGSRENGNSSFFYLLYFLMVKLGKLRTGLNPQDREIVESFLAERIVTGEDLIESCGLSPKGITTIEQFFKKKKADKFDTRLFSFEDINKIKEEKEDEEKKEGESPIEDNESRSGRRDKKSKKDASLSLEEKDKNEKKIKNERLSEQDSIKINEFFSTIRVDDVDKQKEFFEGLCKLSKEAVQFTALECNSVHYFSLLDHQTTAYLNGFPTSGFRSYLGYQSPGFRNFPFFLTEYSSFLKNVNHFVPFQFFSTALHFSPEITPTLTSTSTNSTLTNNLEASPFHSSYFHSGKVTLADNRENFFYGALNLRKCLQNLVYPIGLPTVYAKTANQRGFTLKRFLSRYQDQFFPRLWKIVVSGPLKFKQHVLISRPLNDQNEKRREIYEPTEMKAGKSLFGGGDLLKPKKKSRSSSINSSTEEFIENAILTQDLWEQLQKTCSRSEMGQIQNLEVETAVFWKQEDRVESLHDWYYQATNDKGSFSYQEKDTTLFDSRTKKWYPVELSDKFIEPLIEKAILTQKKSQEGVACEFDVRFLIDAIYRVFTSNTSICSNVVLADVITARARASIWQMHKPSSLGENPHINPISFSSENGFEMKIFKRKPSLEKLEQPELLRKHRNIKESSLESLEFNLQQELEQILKDIPEKDAPDNGGDLTDDKKEKLVEGWKKIIKKDYPRFSNRDLAEVREIIKEKSQFPNKINQIKVLVRNQKFWGPYEIKCDLPVLMPHHKKKSSESFHYPENLM